MKLDTVIAGVIALRDKIDEIKKRQTEELAGDRANLEKLEAYLQNELQKAGVTSFAAKGVGTAYLQNTTSVTVADWEATLAWIRQNELWEMLEHRVSKTVAQEYIESQGAVPPGVNVRTEVEVRVRRG